MGRKQTLITTVLYMKLITRRYLGRKQTHLITRSIFDLFLLHNAFLTSPSAVDIISLSQHL